MRAALFLLLVSVFLGPLEAQYSTLGCTRQVTLPSTTYTVPTYQAQCQCYQPPPPPPPRVNIVPYYYQQPILQQNIVPPQPCPPPPCPPPPCPIMIPLPPPPKDCSCAHTTVQQQSCEPGYQPGHQHGHPGYSRPGQSQSAPTPQQGYNTPIPGLTDAQSKRLVPNLDIYRSHNTPVVVQSVIVGKKGKETEEEKGEKEKEKEEPYKKKQCKKKGSDEVDDDETESKRRKRRRRVKSKRRHLYYDPYGDSYGDHYDPSEYDPCEYCNSRNSDSPRIIYYNS